MSVAERSSLVRAEWDHCAFGVEVIFQRWCLLEAFYFTLCSALRACIVQPYRSHFLPGRCLLFIQEKVLLLSRARGVGAGNETGERRRQEREEVGEALGVEGVVQHLAEAGRCWLS